MVPSGESFKRTFQPVEKYLWPFSDLRGGAGHVCTPSRSALIPVREERPTAPPLEKIASMELSSYSLLTSLSTEDLEREVGSTKYLGR